MGFHPVPGSDLRYGLIAYDANGHERPEAGRNFSETLLDEAASQPVSNVFFFSHGWKGDVPAAIDQYNRWIGAMVKSADFAKAATVFPGFRPMFIGLHWPSIIVTHRCQVCLLPIRCRFVLSMRQSQILREFWPQLRWRWDRVRS